MKYIPTNDILAKELENITKRSSKTFSAFSSGYPCIDETLMGGFQEGNLHCIGGLPSMGKTMVALNMVARQLSIMLQNEVLVFVSTHTSRPVIMQKLLAIGLEMELRKIQNGDLSEDEMSLLETHPFLGKLKSNNLVIVENNKPSLDDIKEVLEALIKEGKTPKMIYVDHIQDMQATETNLNKGQAICSLIKSFKVMSSEYKLPVLYTSKVSKEVLYRKGNQVPQIDDLIDSRLFALETAYIFMVFRPMYYEALGADEIDVNIQELHLVCRKNEHLPLGVLILETELKKHLVLTKPKYEI